MIQHTVLLRSSITRLTMMLGVTAIAGCSSAPDLDTLSTQVSAAFLAEPLTKPDAELIDQNGDSFQVAARTDGRFTLLFFGYTHCPDVCPITMTNVSAALRTLDPDKRAMVDVLFVTADPERDTPERLKEWLGMMDPSIIGLTGDQETLNRMVTEIGFREPEMGEMQMSPEGGQLGHLVNHPTSLMVYTPDGVGRFVYLYGTATPEALTEDLDAFLNVDW